IPLGSLGTLNYVPQVDISGLETFTWTASNFFGPSAVGTVTLSILEPAPEIVIVQDPEAQTANLGTPVTFSVTAVSSLPMSYQWRKNQLPIDGATGATFSISSAAESDEGEYDVVVTNSADDATSAVASLGINDPVIFLQH